MDYGRLFLFMAAATGVMAIGTHLWCWAYRVVERAVFRRKLNSLCQTWERECLEDDEIERRRAAAPRYMTWEQAMADFRGGVPLDDILDSLNGEFPPKAADIQHAGPSTRPGPLNGGLSGPALASVLITMAVFACILGVGLKPEGVEYLIQKAKEQFGGGSPPPPTPGGKA